MSSEDQSQYMSEEDFAALFDDMVDSDSSESHDGSPACSYQDTFHSSPELAAEGDVVRSNSCVPYMLDDAFDIHSSTEITPFTAAGNIHYKSVQASQPWNDDYLVMPLSTSSVEGLSVATGPVATAPSATAPATTVPAATDRAAVVAAASPKTPRRRGSGTSRHKRRADLSPEELDDERVRNKAAAAKCRKNKADALEKALAEAAFWKKRYEDLQVEVQNSIVRRPCKCNCID